MTSASKSIGQHPAPSRTQGQPAGAFYILAIGIDKYQHVNRLHNAVNDVEKLVDLLVSKYRFEASRIIKLLDGKASRSNIHREFRRLRDIITPADTLLIFYSGHGTLDDKDGYWIPVDGIPDDTASFVSNIEIINFLRRIDSRHTLLISDSCFSGTLFLDDETKGSETVHQRLESIPSRWAMTSGRAEPVLDGVPGKHSPFADSLLLHLQRNTEEALPVSQLFFYLREDVGANYTQLPRCEPLRNVGHRGGEFMFRLKDPMALPDPPSPVPSPPPPALFGFGRGGIVAGIATVLLLLVSLYRYTVPNASGSPGPTETNEINQPIPGDSLGISPPGKDTTLPSGPPHTDTGTDVQPEKRPPPKPPPPVKMPGPAVIVAAGKGVIDLPNLPVDTLINYTFTLQNTGESDSGNLNVEVECNDGTRSGYELDGIPAKESKSYTDMFISGDKPGIRRCTLTVQGQTARWVVQARIMPPPPPLCTVKCKTGGVSGIFIRFTDDNNKLYQAVSDNRPVVAFQVPCTIKNKLSVSVYFKKNGGTWREYPISFASGEFELPNLQE